MSEPSGDPRSNWTKVVFAALISAVFTVLASVVVYYFTTKRPRLTYSVSASPVLSSPKGFTSIYAVRVTDAGKTEVDSVECAVTLSGGSIEDARTRINPAIPITESRSAGEYSALVPSLNPGESFTMGLLIETPTENGEPHVGVRGKGVNGERSDQGQAGPEGQPSTIAAGVVAILGFFSLTFVTIVRRGRLPALLPFSGGPYERNETVAHVLAAAGLHEEAEKVRFAPSEMSFMGSSDYIAGVAAKDPTKVRQCALALKALLLVGHIFRGSRDVIVRNLRQLEGDAFDPAEIDSIRRRAKGPDGADLRERIDKLASELEGGPRGVDPAADGDNQRT